MTWPPLPTKRLIARPPARYCFDCNQVIFFGLGRNVCYFAGARRVAPHNSQIGSEVKLPRAIPGCSSHLGPLEGVEWRGVEWRGSRCPNGGARRQKGSGHRGTAAPHWQKCAWYLTRPWLRCLGIGGGSHVELSVCWINTFLNVPHSMKNCAGQRRWWSGICVFADFFSMFYLLYNFVFCTL